LFPGIGIAQFRFQVIGNCGVIFPVQRSNHLPVRIFVLPEGKIGPELNPWVV
jgi:hypothetical protein